MHQVLMHGRSHKELGCTVNASPYTEEDRFASNVKMPATLFCPSELFRPVYSWETAPSASIESLEYPVVDQDPVMLGRPTSLVKMAQI